jgi:hypothetical protein
VGISSVWFIRELSKREGLRHGTHHYSNLLICAKKLKRNRSFFSTFHFCPCLLSVHSNEDHLFDITSLFYKLTNYKTPKQAMNVKKILKSSNWAKSAVQEDKNKESNIPTQAKFGFGRWFSFTNGDVVIIGSSSQWVRCYHGRGKKNLEGLFVGQRNIVKGGSVWL